MVTILPRYDPGGEIGRSIGSGIGGMLEQHANQNRIASGLEALQNLDLQNLTVPQIMSEATKAFAGIPGGMQALESLMPTLIEQKKAMGESQVRQAWSQRQQEKRTPQPEMQFQQSTPEPFQYAPPQSQPQVQADPVIAPSSNQSLVQKRNSDRAESQELKQRAMQAARDIAEKPQPQPQPVIEQTQLQRNVQSNGQIGPGAKQTPQPRYETQMSPDAQRVPTLDEPVPEYEPVSQEDAAFIYDQFQKQGQGTDAAAEFIRKENERRQQEFQQRTANRQVRQEQLQQERNFEQEQEQRIRDYVSEELGVENVDPYESEKGYQYFQDFKKQNPKKTDRQVWNEAREKFNQMRNSFAKAESQFERPSFLRARKEQKVKAAKQWTQQHLNKFGNRQQDRDKLITMFMDKGFNRAEANSIVRPMSDSLKKSIKDIPRGTKTYPVAQGGQQFKPVTGEERQQVVEKVSDMISNNLKPSDSLILLRDQLNREKGIDEGQFQEALETAIERMKEQGKTLTPEQSEDIANMNEPVQPSLMEIFQTLRFDLRDYFPVKAK